MPKEFPIGTIRHWETGDVIKAHDPTPPYSNGWIPLVESAELDGIGRECDQEARTILTHKEPINGERFLDHEINEYTDEHGQKPYTSDDFKQYFGFFGAGQYSFRNEFSKRFMSNKMKLSEQIANALSEANEDAGGDKHNDVLSKETRDEIRRRVRAAFKEDENTFNINDARALQSIVQNTSVKLAEGEDIKDPVQREIYNVCKNEVDFLDEEYEHIKVQQEVKRRCIAQIRETFPDNWGICDSFEHFANEQFSTYVRRFTEEIKRDSIEDLKAAFGVTLDMPTEEFYDRIIGRFETMSEDERHESDEIFKYLIYIRFAVQYHKEVEGDWSLEHVPALYNLEKAIGELPLGHFLDNDQLTLITSKDYRGGSHGGYAWYDPSEGRMNFSARCINKGSVFGVLANPGEFRSTLFHEIGHAVSMKFGRTSQYDYKKFVVECGWTYQSKELRAGLTATGGDTSIPRTGSNSQLELISDYSSKAPEESFAEYYSFYCCNKDAIDQFVATKDSKALEGVSQWTTKGDSDERTLRQIMHSNILSTDDDSYKEFVSDMNTTLSQRGVDCAMSLVSPWHMELNTSQKKRYDPTYIKTYKDKPQQEQLVFAYKDGQKRVVFHGGNDAAISKMNRKMCSVMEVPKELYFHFREKGYLDIQITDCLTTLFQHQTPKKQVEPPTLKRGLMHRDDFIDSKQLATNYEIFAAMKRVFDSPELAKALQELFGGSENDIEKARIHKYIRKEPDGKGGWKYEYPEENSATTNAQILAIPEPQAPIDMEKDIVNLTAIESLLEDLGPEIHSLVQRRVEHLEKEEERTATQWDREWIELMLTYDMVRSFEKYTLPTDKVISVESQTSFKGNLEISAEIERDGRVYPYETEVIFAEGPIQHLHYRYITKTPLPQTQNNSTLSDQIHEKIKRMTKVQKLNDEIAQYERRIIYNEQNATAAEQLSDQEILDQDPHYRTIWKELDWTELQRRGADKNYGNEENFLRAKTEATASSIAFFKKMKIQSLRDNNTLLQRQISKLQSKLVEIGDTTTNDQKGHKQWL